MNRYKKLIGNSAIFAIGSLGSKLISFLLIPFYTFILSKSQFGIVDLIVTAVSMMLPVLTFSIYDAVFRFILDKTKNENSIFTNGIFISSIGSLIGLIMIPLLNKFNVPFSEYIYLLLVTGVFLSLMLNFCRAIGKVKIFAIAGILGTIVTAGANIIFLLVFEWGIKGYLISILLSNITVILFIVFSTKAWALIKLRYLNRELMISMIMYSLPLIPNAFSWWINTSADRFFILAFVGASANGIYAVASKIPTLLNILNQIFFQSWQMSAVEEFDSHDASMFYTKTFNYFFSFQFIGAAGILVFLKPVMRVIVSPSFYVAWEYIPFLLLSVIYSSLSGFLGTTYTAAKRTAGIFLTTIIGAFSNIVLGFMFVPWLGVQGASFAGFLSFAIVLIIRLVDTRKFMPISVDINNAVLNHVAIVIMILGLFIFKSIFWGQIVEIILFLCVILVNRKVFTGIWNLRKREHNQ